MYQKLAKKFLELSGIEEAKNNIEGISEAVIKNWRYMIYKRLWDELELDSCLDDIEKRDSKITFNLCRTTFLMALQHLLDPMSKLGTFNHQDRYAKLHELKLQHLYRSLNILSRNKERIEEHIFYQNYNLLNMKVNVVFYDVTTYAFESVNRDEIRDFGYSKDNKYNEVQVVIGLLIDSNGFPIGYELYRGNIFDAKTMTGALDNLKRRFGIRRVIIVADRGLNSKINLKMIHDAGYGYIVASSVRKMDSKLQSQVLDPHGYMDIEGPVKDEDEPERLRYKIIEHVNPVRDEKGNTYNLDENIIITYSQRRAKKNKADREHLVEKCEKLIEEPAKINASIKRGGRKYLKIESTTEEKNTHWILDEAKILKDEKYDGYYGIQTSEKDMKPKDILDAYHTLWKIEESFRIMKSTLEVRPIFHWTEERIKGHFVVCFLSFLLERKLEYNLKQAGIADASPGKISETINKMEFAEVNLSDTNTT